jgi:hypothetical protein
LATKGCEESDLAALNKVVENNVLEVDYSEPIAYHIDNILGGTKFWKSTSMWPSKEGLERSQAAVSDLYYFAGHFISACTD